MTGPIIDMYLWIYSKDGCSYCEKAKEWCIKNDIRYQERLVNERARVDNDEVGLVR